MKVPTQTRGTPVTEGDGSAGKVVDRTEELMSNKPIIMHHGKQAGTSHCVNGRQLQDDVQSPCDILTSTELPVVHGLSCTSLLDFAEICRNTTRKILFHG